VGIVTSIRNFAYCVVLATLAFAAPAAARVPEGFVGTMLDGPAARLDPPRLASELDLMRSSGVETVRTVWSWRSIQPYAAWAAVPDAERERFRDVDGLPLAVARTDALVALAARRGIRILPVTLETPSWIARRLTAGAPPREVGPYAAFMRALVTRYGHTGGFWREHPDLPRRPVRWWQLWNEPHLSAYWAAPRWESGYAALVRGGARAVHRADARARVLLAGVTTDEVPVWDNVDALLAEGIGPEVDMVAAHVFTGTPRNVVRALRRVRATLEDYGLGRTPIALTEWSWPSSRGRQSWATTERGQARRVAATLRLLARSRRALGLRTTVHYTWMSQDDGRAWSGWAGLRRFAGGRIVSKPALAAFGRTARALRR
jgi:hypothetical protein